MIPMTAAARMRATSEVLRWAEGWPARACIIRWMPVTITEALRLAAASASGARAAL
jgi:hypothetical protein